MMGEKTDYAAFIHVVMMSVPAMVVALTVEAQSWSVFTEIYFIKEPLANH